MERFSITDLPITGLKLITRKVEKDNRGSFSKLFCAHELSKVFTFNPISQINISISNKKGTIRGLHTQIQPYLENKIIYCIKGKVWDVALDIRANSPTFLSWHSQILSEENMQSLFIPAGLSHGFQALSDNVELIYIHDAPYSSAHECRLNPFDPLINIKWPLQVTELSDADKNAPFISKDFCGIQI